MSLICTEEFTTSSLNRQTDRQTHIQCPVPLKLDEFSSYHCIFYLFSSVQFLVCLSVCLSASTFQEPHKESYQTSPHFPWLMRMIVAQCSSGGVAMSCTSGLVDDVMFSDNRPNVASTASRMKARKPVAESDFEITTALKTLSQAHASFQWELLWLSTFFSGTRLGVRPLNRSSRKWLKRRRLKQGCAFWSKNWKFLYHLAPAPKNRQNLATFGLDLENFHSISL